MVVGRRRRRLEKSEKKRACAQESERASERKKERERERERGRASERESMGEGVCGEERR